jgi:hypothetical protein
MTYMANIAMNQSPFQFQFTVNVTDKHLTFIGDNIYFLPDVWVHWNLEFTECIGFEAHNICVSSCHEIGSSACFSTHPTTSSNKGIPEPWTAGLPNATLTVDQIVVVVNGSNIHSGY